MRVRDSFVFYRSFYEAIKDLPDAEQVKSFQAIAEYALNDQVPDGGGIEKTVFSLAKPQIDANNKKYQNGTKGGRPKTDKEPSDNQTITKHKPNHNQTITKAEPNVNDNVNVNVNDNEKIESRAKATRFVPPTLENVSGYCQEKGYKIDPERFIDFYTAKDWMIGKNKMKDWRAAVRNWSRQDKGASVSVKPKATGFSNFEQRDTDYDALVLDQVKSWISEEG